MGLNFKIGASFSEIDARRGSHFGILALIQDLISEWA
jgi:hypothetical protein